MFTGLIEDLGTVARVEGRPQGARLSVETRLPAADLAHGKSIAVEGVCLTVVEREGSRIGFDVSAESLSRSTLGDLVAGARVNLERPMALGERLGGHLVLGHVDGVGRVVSRERVGDSVRFVVELPEGLAPLVVAKGSIALDGISLTVNELKDPGRIGLMLIPETLRATTWGEKQSGARVNVEADILAKHVQRLMESSPWNPLRK